MRIKSEITIQGKDPVATLQSIARKIELKIHVGIRKSVMAVKRHLVAMTATRLVRRSGALLKEVTNANVDVVSTGTLISGTLKIPGMTANKRGQLVSQYLTTHFGKGVTTIKAKKGSMLAIPIKGGPANAFRSNFSTLATAAPKDFPGIKIRIGQVLYAGNRGKGRDLYPGWVLRPSVTIRKRINPQDAVDEAQMEILENFRGLVESVN